MTTIGQLESVNRDGAQALQGHIATLALDCSILLLPTGEATGSSRPAYRVHAEKAADTLVEIGAAWRKQKKDGSGESFLSLTLDDPSFERPINVAAFANGSDGTYQITWRRQTDRNAKAV
ncbi:DUF736 domain-containing protein [Minwuia sp.]|uniref:DUF736 domain-containing protein n=1 Tax=Minwuia sp. TaxID=2493630 RepID=UPI003A930CA5